MLSQLAIGSTGNVFYVLPYGAKLQVGYPAMAAVPLLLDALTRLRRIPTKRRYIRLSRPGLE